MNAIRRSTLARRLISGWLVAGGPFAAAHAADLPTLKAAPIAYVMTCNVGGMAGFVIPGSDTCLRISGYVNLEIAAGNVARQSGLAFTGVPGASPVTAE